MTDSQIDVLPETKTSLERDTTYTSSYQAVGKRGSIVGPQFESKGPDPYFEVKIVKGDDNEFVIGVGYAPSNHRSNSFPGWRTSSYGVHGDDGGFFDGRPFISKTVSRPWVTGDVIGCGINPTRKEMYWTLNGELLFTSEKIVLLMYHAVIGLRDSKDRVEVNFGTRPFMYRKGNLPDANSKIANMGLITFDNKDIRVEPLLDEAEQNQKLIWKVEVINTCKANVMSTSPLLVPSHSIHAEDCVYYELEVLSGGGNGAIGLGWAYPPCPRESMPGWSVDSYGYHSDDGCLYREQGWPLDSYGPKFESGDFVGCGIEKGPDGKFQIFYTVNGKYLGIAFKCVPVKAYILMVGMVQSAAAVRLNTQGPFVYPFEYKTPPEKLGLRFDGVQFQLDSTEIIEYNVRAEVGQIFGVKSLISIDEQLQVSPQKSVLLQASGASDQGATKSTATGQQSLYPVSKAIRLFNLKEILVEPTTQPDEEGVELTHVVSVEEWVEKLEEDQNIDKMIRRVFDFVDEDCNGALGHLETCIGLCYLLGTKCLEPGRLKSSEEEDLLPQQAKFKEVDKEQFRAMFFVLLPRYLAVNSSVKTGRSENFDFRRYIEDNFISLLKFFDTTPVARRMESVGCTRLVVDTWKRLLYFCAYLLFPFVFLKSCLQDLVMDGNASRGVKYGVCRDILLGLVGIFILWPILVIIYYIGVVGPILYGVYFESISARGHLVSGTEIVVPLVGILMVFFFALKNGWGSQESLGCLRKISTVYEAVMNKEFQILQTSRGEMYRKAWEKRLRPFRDFLVTVDVCSLQGVKQQLRLGAVMAKMKGAPSNKYSDVLKRTTVKYILPVIFAVGAGIVPGLVRVIHLHVPFFGETWVENAIAALYMGLTIPVFYLVLNGLSNNISEHARQLKLYRTLRDVTTAKGVSTTSQLKFYVDLSISRNIDKWMEMRKTAIEDQRHKDRSQFLVGPILLTNLCLALAVLYRVLSRLSPQEILNVLDNAVDISNILAIYLCLITFGYIAALLVVLVQQNEMISTQHIKMMMQRKYRMARNLWDVDDGEKELLRRQIIVLESAVERIQTSENRVEILGIVVDRRFALSVGTTVLTGAVTGILRLAGVI